MLYRLDNIDKITNTMLFGSNNIKAEYEMNGTFLEEVTEERDISVIIENDLKIKCSSHRIKFKTASRFKVRLA